MLPDTTIKEMLSIAAINAICAYSGYTSTANIKDFGIDGYISEVEFDPINKYQETGQQLHFQAKATDDVQITDTELIYKLRNKNYNMLISTNFPFRILILFVLPKDKSTWLNVCHDALSIQNCAYYINLVGTGEFKANLSSRTTIHIPKAQIFTGDTIKQFMDKQRKYTIQLKKSIENDIDWGSLD